MLKIRSNTTGYKFAVCRIMQAFNLFDSMTNPPSDYEYRKMKRGKEHDTLITVTVDHVSGTRTTTAKGSAS